MYSGDVGNNLGFFGGWGVEFNYFELSYYFFYFAQQIFSARILCK